MLGKALACTFPGASPSELQIQCLAGSWKKVQLAPHRPPLRETSPNQSKDPLKKRLSHIDPLQTGKIRGAFYALISLIIVPFVLLGSLAATAVPEGSDGMAFFGIGIGFALFLPVIYGVLGFILGLIASLIYNLLAKWIGGLEFELEDVR